MKKISDWGPADHFVEFLAMLAGLWLVCKIVGWAIWAVFWLGAGVAFDLSGAGAGVFVRIGTYVLFAAVAGALGYLITRRQERP